MPAFAAAFSADACAACSHSACGDHADQRQSEPQAHGLDHHALGAPRDGHGPRHGGDVINAIDMIMAGDLKIVAKEMDATALQVGAFKHLIPKYNEADTETVTVLYAVDSAVSEDAAVKQVAKRLDSAISLLQIDDDVIDPSMSAPRASAAVNPGLDWTTLHYEYSGSVSVASKVLTENHGMGMRIVAVQITRTAVA